MPGAAFPAVNQLQPNESAPLLSDIAIHEKRSTKGICVLKIQYWYVWQYMTMEVTTRGFEGLFNGRLI